MKKKLIITILVFLSIGITIYFINGQSNIKNKDIEQILETQNYSYLSPTAKDYVKNYYNETGNILLTEKNKTTGEEYLNPDYVEYLDNETTNNTGYIPSEVTYDYNFDYNTNSLTASELPSQYDSRNVNGNNYVTPLKKQFSNLCWNFAFTSVIETKLLKSGLENNTSTLDLSERVMDYATTDPISAIDTEKNPYYGGYSLNSLSESGNEYRYSSVLINGIFPTSESYWEYDTDYMGKVKPEDIFDLNKSNYQVNEVRYIEDNNYNVGLDEDTNKLLKQYIIEHGSVGLSLRVGAGRNYVSYQASEEEQLNTGVSQNKLYYKPANALYQSNDHMVAIIGWDDNYEHNICVDDSGQLSNATNNNGTYNCTNSTLKVIKGAWITKDSADQQHHYVAYETVNSDYFVVTDISTKDWNNVYSSSNQEAYTKKDSYTYVFTKKDNAEKIKSIKFYTQQNITNGKIYVDTNDGTGKKLLATINTEIGGLYTIQITEEYILTKNTFNIEASGISNFSIFTTNYDSNTILNIEDSTVVNSFNYQGILGEHQNLIVAKGVSRNINGNINIIIKDKNNIDVTNSFTIIRNYPVGNYISTIIKFNNDVAFGEYTAYAYVNETLETTFKLTIDKHMENVSGDGSMENPFIITNPAQLDMIRLNNYNYYILGNDIDLTYDTKNENGLFYNNGQGWDPIDYSDCSVYSTYSINCSDGFSGMLDGNNHKIIGLYINRPNEDIVGLFRNTYNNNFSGLNFKNLIFKDVDITGRNYVGTVIGYAFGTTYERTLMFENISVTGNIKGNNYVGGLIGYYKAGTGLPNYLVENTECVSRHCLDNLYNSASIEANNYAGGIIGLAETQTYYNITNEKWRSTIKGNNWQNNGTIISTNNGAGLIGHLVIHNGNIVTITNAINTDKNSKNPSIINNVECKNTNDTYPTCSFNLNNIYYTNDIAYQNNDIINANNVTKYTISELTNAAIYNSFTNFNTLYKKEANKIAFIKNAYTENITTQDISINNNQKVNVYDYINGGNKNIVYSIENNTIASIDNSGNIIPLKNGTTKINIISYYDGSNSTIDLTIDNTIETYTITYNLNGGSGNNPTSYTNESNTFTLKQPAKKGYTFIGWTGSNGTSPETEVTITKGTTGNLTYTANWEPLKFTITFNNNNGNGTMNNQTFEYDITQKISKNTFTKDGYTFINWNTKSDGSGTNYSDEESIKIENNIILYAIWKEEYDFLVNEYSVDKINNYIDLIECNTTVEEFAQKFKLNSGYRIEVEHKTINGQKILFTGGKTKIYKNDILYDEYTNIIRGDVNGNAVIDIIDYIRIMKDIMNTTKLSGEYKKAADVNQNNTIDIIDYIRIMKMIMEENQ